MSNAAFAQPGTTTKPQFNTLKKYALELTNDRQLAAERIRDYFDANPDALQAHREGNRLAQRQRFTELLDKYQAASEQRYAELTGGNEPASRKQITMLVTDARTAPEAKRIEVLGKLNRGVHKRQASAMIRDLKASVQVDTPAAA